MSSAKLSAKQRGKNARAYVTEVKQHYNANNGCNDFQTLVHDVFFPTHGISFTMERPVKYYVSPSTPSPSTKTTTTIAAADTARDDSDAPTNQEKQQQQQKQQPSQQHLEYVFFDPLTMTQPKKAAYRFCRCGIVEFALHFAVSDQDMVMHDVALKILNRNELKRQQDDPVREADAMAALRPPGFPGGRRGAKLWERGEQLIPRWRTIVDGENVYTATEFASNGNLIEYAHWYLQRICLEVGEQKKDAIMAGDFDTSMFRRAVSRVWRHAALSIFAGVASAVAWLHSRGVAHLDLDPYNVVVDKVGNPLIVDFGSAECWRDVDNDRAMVGRGRPILCKPRFAAPELLVHNRSFRTSEGVRGDAADCWALGSMLYWLLLLHASNTTIATAMKTTKKNAMVWTGDKFLDPVGNDPKWMSRVNEHAAHGNWGRENCQVCKLELDPEVEQILLGLLNETEPARRLSASDVADRMREFPVPIIEYMDDLEKLPEGKGPQDIKDLITLVEEALEE